MSRFSKRIATGLLLVLAVFAPAGADAQRDPGNWNQDYDPHVAALGLAAGYTSGTGLAFRWPALPQTMMSVAGGAWGKSSDLAWNVGIELHYVLRQVGRTRLVVGPAVGFYSDDEDDDVDENFSLNFGVEWLVRPRVALKTDIGFTYLSEDETVYPLPQVAVFYYF